MYTIVGAGFGLYGYLPAVVRGLGERVLLPRSLEPRIKARPDLAGIDSSITWVDSVEIALESAEGVIIATPPDAQVALAERCAALSNIRRIVLEKPVATTPRGASKLLATLDAAGKRYRVGYTLPYTVWHADLRWPTARGNSAKVCLQWTFAAHHFVHDLQTWKRRHEEGGGALRFFGIHVIALLACHGYDVVSSSVIEGTCAAEPERWRAVFQGRRLPTCEVIVDSRSAQRAFSIRQDKFPFVALAEPFGAEHALASLDPRVGVLARLLATFDADDGYFQNLYRRVNALWHEAETR
jgi:predicted dehydrogenase